MDVDVLALCALACPGLLNDLRRANVLDLRLDILFDKDGQRLCLGSGGELEGRCEGRDGLKPAVDGIICWERSDSCARFTGYELRASRETGIAATAFCMPDNYDCCRGKKKKKFGWNVASIEGKRSSTVFNAKVVDGVGQRGQRAIVIEMKLAKQRGRWMSGTRRG